MVSETWGLGKPRGQTEERSQAQGPRAESRRKRGSGVPNRKWYSLIDKVWRMDNLQAAAKRVLANQGAAGVDGQTCPAFGANLESERLKLHEELRAKSYRPQPVRRVYIPKANGGQRPLGVPAVRDPWSNRRCDR